jgi:pimeloyl-ACP methyl ester carboxylesterase
MAKMPIRKGELQVEVFENLLARDTVFLHGNVASNIWWKPLRQELKRRANFLAAEKLPSISPVSDSTTGNSSIAKAPCSGKMICIEWLGCGRSSNAVSEADLHPSALAQDTLDIIKTLHLGQIDIVGHSTGGLIAVFAMLQSPEVFRSAVLLDPVGANGITFEDSTLDAFVQMGQDRSFAAAIMSATIHGNDPTDPLFGDILDDAMRAAPVTGRGVLKQLRTIDISQELPKISHKMLVLHGEHDAVLPIADSRKLADLIPNASFVELDGQGHSANFENPKRFADIILEFLK